MGEPISTAAVFAFLNSCFKLAEYAVKIYSVESENGVFVRMILRIRQDLEETERLLSVPSVKARLISTPQKSPWIRGAVLSTKAALNEIGRWVERVRSEKAGYGNVSFESRVRWVFNDQEKMVSRSMELRTSHQTLSTVLAYLSPLELEKPTTVAKAEPPKYDDATFFDELLSPRQRRLKALTASAGNKNENMDNKGFPATSTNAQHLIRPSSSMSFLPGSFPVSNVFPTSNTLNISVCKATTQDNTSISCDPNADTRPYSGSLESIYGIPVSSHFSVSSVQLPTPSSSATPFPSSSSFTTRSSDYFVQEQLPLSPTTSPSWTDPPPAYSTLVVLNPADATTIKSSVPVPSNAVQLKSLPSTYSPPMSHPPFAPPPQTAGKTSSLEVAKGPQPVAPCQPSFSIISPPPEETSQIQPSRRLSIMSSTGPVDPYEFWVPTLSPERLPISSNEPTVSGQPLNPATIPGFPSAKHPIREQVLPLVPAKITVPSNVAEMMGDLSLNQAETNNDLAGASKHSSAGKQSGFCLKENRNSIPSWSTTVAVSSKLPVETEPRHFSMPSLPPKIPEKIHGLRPDALTRSKTAPSGAEGMPSFTVSQFTNFSTPKGNISYATNINRQKTRKWVEAKPGDYTGDQWANEEEYNFGPAPPKPAETPPPWKHNRLDSQPQSQYQFDTQQNTQEMPSRSIAQEQQYVAYSPPLPPPSVSKQQVTSPEQQYVAYSPPLRPPSVTNRQVTSPEQQYNPYRPLVPPRKPLDPGANIPISPIRSPDLFHQQQSPPPSRSFTVSPPTQTSTPAQGFSSAVPPENQVARSETVGETRRRNLKALLASMRQGTPE